MRFVSLVAAVFLATALAAGYALAVGGGGGGGGGGSPPGGGGGGDSGAGAGSTAPSSGGGSPPGVSTVTCLDTGAVKFTMHPVQKFNFTRLSDNLTFAVNGTWNGEDFESEEAVFTKPGQYRLTSELGLTQEFTCPAFRFSCRIVQLNALSCVNAANGTTATFEMLSDDRPENLKLSYKLPRGKVLSYTPQTYSPELSGLKVTHDTPTRYSVTIHANISPDGFEVLHNLCVGKSYVYSRINCTSGRPSAAESGKELKCSGYLDIRDRVSCRLDLRQEQRNEYENFFPEECKSGMVNAAACLQLYQKVQACWQFPNGDGRIQCVKQQIGLRGFSQEKAQCGQLPDSQKTACLRSYNSKVYALVKFRLYNLEEEAEKLADKGLLSKADLTDFVVSLELKKQAFNIAATKDGKARIILDARGLWNSLVQNMQQGAK